MTQATEPPIFDGVLRHNYQISDLDLDELIEPCIFGGKRIATLRKFNTHCAF